MLYLIIIQTIYLGQFIMNEKTCFFIGSRHATDSIKEQLVEAVEKHITEYGVTTFTVGHYGLFDRLE